MITLSVFKESSLVFSFMNYAMSNMALSSLTILDSLHWVKYVLNVPPKA